MKKLIGIVAMFALVVSFVVPPISNSASSPVMGEEVLPPKVSQLIAKLLPEQKEICTRYYQANMALGHVNEEIAVAQLNNILKLKPDRRDALFTMLTFGPPEAVTMSEKVPDRSSTIYKYIVPNLIENVTILALFSSFSGPLMSIFSPTLPAILRLLDVIVNLGIRGIVPGMEVSFGIDKLGVLIRDCRGEARIATAGFKILQDRPHLPFVASVTPEEPVLLAPLLSNSDTALLAAGPVISAHTAYYNDQLWAFGGTAEESFVGDIVRYLLMEVPQNAGSPPPQKVGVVAVNYPLVIEMVGIFKSDFWKRMEEMYGVEVAGIELCPMNPTSVTPQLIKLKNKGVDTLLMVGFGRTGALMIKDLHRMKMAPRDGYTVIGIPFEGTVRDGVGQEGGLDGIYTAFVGTLAPDDLDFAYVKKAVDSHHDFWPEKGGYGIFTAGPAAVEAMIALIVNLVDRIASGDLGTALGPEADRLMGDVIRKYELEEKVEMMREKYEGKRVGIEERSFTFKELTELAEKMSFSELEQSFMPSAVFVKEVAIEMVKGPNLIKLGEQVGWEEMNHNCMGGNAYYGLYPEMFLPGKGTMQNCLSWQWKGEKLLNVEYRSGKPWEWFPPGIIPGPGPSPPHGWAPPPLDGTPIEYGHPWGTWTVGKFLAEYDVPLWWFILEYAFDSNNQLNKGLLCEALNTYFNKKKVVYDWGDPHREVWQWGEEAYREVDWSSSSERVRVLEEFKEMYYLPSRMVNWIDEYIASCVGQTGGLVCVPCLPLPG